MYLKILMYYILGYVNVVVEGFFIERFINMCISKKIFFWKIDETARAEQNESRQRGASEA